MHAGAHAGIPKVLRASLRAGVREGVRTGLVYVLAEPTGLRAVFHEPTCMFRPSHHVLTYHLPSPPACPPSAHSICIVRVQRVVRLSCPVRQLAECVVVSWAKPWKLLLGSRTPDGIRMCTRICGCESGSSSTCSIAQ
eukprot:6196975-Pleurochrysis_carterae.AAC.2